MSESTRPLPRLLYVGDVPVESSFHGSALLYRLLQDYPHDKLMVVESERFPSLPARRLPRVPYRSFSLRAQRLQNTRFSRWACTWLALTSGKAGRLRRSVADFAPEAFLTVAHGYTWLAVSQLAQESKVPLHMIVHDDWPTTTPMISWLKEWRHRIFGGVYRRVHSRLCVSDGMEAEYRQRYGVGGQVLYPVRAKDCPSSDLEPKTYAKANGPLVGAFAGNIFSNGYARLIRSLATSLERRNGRLMIFGPHHADALRSRGLDRPNILVQGLIDSRDLIVRLRDEADFLFVPMEFDSGGNEWNMRLSFPSKLTDYTATGLPLLICGPDYCSAVRWARQYAPVAELVVSEAEGDLAAALGRLERTDHRKLLGQAARNVGNHLFSHRPCVDTFHRALSRPCTASPSTLPRPSTRDRIT